MADPPPFLARAGPGWHWWLTLVGLTITAGLVLPLAAWIVEAVSDRAENWTLPLQATIVLALAAGIGWMRAEPAHRRRSVALTFGAGIVAVLVADALWRLVLAG